MCTLSLTGFQDWLKLRLHVTSCDTRPPCRRHHQSSCPFRHIRDSLRSQHYHRQNLRGDRVLQAFSGCCVHCHISSASLSDSVAPSSVLAVRPAGWRLAGAIPRRRTAPHSSYAAQPFFNEPPAVQMSNATRHHKRGAYQRFGDAQHFGLFCRKPHFTRIMKRRIGKRQERDWFVLVWVREQSSVKERKGIREGINGKGRAGNV